MMKKNKGFIWLFFLACTWTHSQTNIDSSCQIYLEPIIGFKMVIEDYKSDLLDNFDSYREVPEDELKNKLKDIDVFNASKSIELPNGYKTNITFILHFKEKKLKSYNLTFPIGTDYKYFDELIKYIQHYDKNNINSFIYKSGKKSIYTDLNDNKNCKRIIRVSRIYNDNTKFEIYCKVN